jgi:ankyrin repeat protein
MEKDGTTALMRAVERGRLEAVEKLIERKARVNSTNSFGETALHFAILKEDISFLKALLTAGADPNIQNDQGLSPLHIAAGKRRILSGPIYSSPASAASPEQIELLLKHKADPNLRDTSGVTPLGYAVMFGPAQAVALFISAKAEINPQDKNGYTPLDYARTEQLQDLLEQAGATNSPVFLKTQEQQKGQGIQPFSGTLPAPAIPQNPARRLRRPASESTAQP